MYKLLTTLFIVIISFVLATACKSSNQKIMDKHYDEFYELMHSSQYCAAFHTANWYNNHVRAGDKKISTKDCNAAAQACLKFVQ